MSRGLLSSCRSWATPEQPQKPLTQSPLQLSGPAHGVPTEEGRQTLAVSSQYVPSVHSLWLAQEARGVTQRCVAGSQTLGGVHWSLPVHPDLLVPPPAPPSPPVPAPPLPPVALESSAQPMKEQRRSAKHRARAVCERRFAAPPVFPIFRTVIRLMPAQQICEAVRLPFGKHTSGLARAAERSAPAGWRPPHCVPAHSHASGIQSYGARSAAGKARACGECRGACE